QILEVLLDRPAPLPPDPGQLLGDPLHEARGPQQGLGPPGPVLAGDHPLLVVHEGLEALVPLPALLPPQVLGGDPPARLIEIRGPANLPLSMQSRTSLMVFTSIPMGHGSPSGPKPRKATSPKSICWISTGTFRARSGPTRSREPRRGSTRITLRPPFVGPPAE